MKLVLLTLCLSTLAFSGLVNLSANCPEQFVPNPDNICIRPSYIEGCQKYKNPNECAACSKGNQSSIQITKSLIENAAGLLAALRLPLP